MEIYVRDDRRILEIWLTREERRDQALKEKLEPIYRQYKAKKYTAAVFLSGNGDLAEMTGALLRRGKRRSAELEVAQQRTQRGGITR